MKRPIEKQLAFPLLSLTYNPLGNRPVVITVDQDWGLSGEVHASYIRLQDLVDCNRMIVEVQNMLADLIVEEEKERDKRKDEIEKGAPF